MNKPPALMAEGIILLSFIAARARLRVTAQHTPTPTICKQDGSTCQPLRSGISSRRHCITLFPSGAPSSPRRLATVRYTANVNKIIVVVEFTASRPGPLDLKQAEGIAPGLVNRSGEHQQNFFILLSCLSPSGSLPPPMIEIEIPTPGQTMFTSISAPIYPRGEIQ